MTEIRFNAPSAKIPEYVLNHKTESPFEKNNIRFRIDGHYLTDFSDKGIDNFIEEHYNENTGWFFGWGGKDLELADVKAFIQTVAANADKVAGATFDLTDPELGLFDDDKIKAKDLSSSFTLKFSQPPGSSATEVSFVDVGSAGFHRADYDKAKEAYETAKGKFDDIADQIGGSAVERLLSLDNELNTIREDMASLNSDVGEYRNRISELKAGGADENDVEVRQLRRAIRGIELEQDDLKKREKEINKDLNQKHGFFLFRWFGGGSNLNELRSAKAAMDAAEERMNTARAVMDGTAPPSSQSVAEGENTTTTPPPAPAPLSAETFAQLSSSVAQTEALLQMNPATQYEYLGHVKPENRQALMGTFDDYLQAGLPNNPLGLPPQDFEQVSQVRDSIADLRLNAFLNWGTDFQNQYVDSLAPADQDALRKELEAKILAAAAEQNLLNRLGLSAEDSSRIREEIQQLVAKLQTTPVQPSAPETPVQPSAPETPVQSSAPETPVQPSAPETPVQPSAPETPVQPSAPETPVSPPVADNEEVFQPQPNQPRPQPPAEETKEPPVQPAPQPQRDPFNPYGNGTPNPPVVEQEPGVPAPQPVTAPTATGTPTAAQTALTLENVLWARDLELKVGNQGYEPTPLEQQRHQSVSETYMAEMAWAQELETKFPDYQPTDAEKERYLKIFEIYNNVSGQSEQTPVIPQPSTPEVRTAPPAEEPIAPQPVPSQTPSDVPPPIFNPVGPAAPSDNTRVDMPQPSQPGVEEPSSQIPTNDAPAVATPRTINAALANEKLQQLKTKLAETHHSGDEQKLIASLSREVWSNGTQEQRMEMAKALVQYSDDITTFRGDYYGLLYDLLNASPILGDGMTVQEVGATVAYDSFPVARFMNGLSDSQASGILGWVATSGAPGAKKFIETTIKAYTGTIKDREQPFKDVMADTRAAQAIEAMGLKPQVEKLLD